MVWTQKEIEWVDKNYGLIEGGLLSNSNLQSLLTKAEKDLGMVFPKKLLISLSYLEDPSGFRLDRMGYPSGRGEINLVVYGPNDYLNGNRILSYVGLGPNDREYNDLSLLKKMLLNSLLGLLGSDTKGILREIVDKASYPGEFK